MMNLSNISKIYFVGIGGIGMSALARYFSQKGKLVFGYDRTRSKLAMDLEREGIIIGYEDGVEHLEKNVDLVVYTPAIPSNHPQLEWYRQNGYTLKKRSEVLGAITESKFCIAVAGSHGKTTVSSMIAHILHRTHGCTAFLGGIATNYNSNYLYANSDTVVVEADEFDRSFLTLAPNMAIITSIDSDHLDIYGSLEKVEEEFIAFSQKIVDNGLLLLHESLNHLKGKFPSHLKIETYGEQSFNEYNLKIARVQHGLSYFNINLKEGRIKDLISPFGGNHNLLNATAAIAIAKAMKVEDEHIRAALLQFKGIKRRLEKHLYSKEIVYLDDYAHHPNEIKALLDAIKGLYPDRKITAVFQPHLYTRTRDLANDFALALSEADRAVVLPIYPARELPIEGVDSSLITTKMNDVEVSIVERDEVISFLRDKDLELVVTIGAGDIDVLVEPMKEFLTHRMKTES